MERRFSAGSMAPIAFVEVLVHHNREPVVVPGADMQAGQRGIQGLFAGRAHQPTSLVSSSQFLLWKEVKQSGGWSIAASAWRWRKTRPRRTSGGSSFWPGRGSRFQFV